MTKEIFIDRSGNRINPKDLHKYEVIGFWYEEESDTMVWEYTKLDSYSLMGVLAIIGCLGLIIFTIIIWFVISLI